MNININKLKWLNIAIIITIILFCVPSYSNAQNYNREGNTFVANNTKSKANAKKTNFTWQESDGTKYDIYISSTGSCFIKKISKKSGKEYPKYLGPEISQEICKEMNITYKGKTTKVKNS